MTLRIGCTADDFTGGTDVAAAFRRAGLRTALVFGTPDETTVLPADCDAAVVALKSRSTPADEAVADSLATQRWLWSKGAAQVYFKYCSTFDSTPQGNIGPVTDALMDAAGAGVTLHCPASPPNGRTVYQGHLFVHDQLLSDSPLRHHPLNPMTDSALVRLLSAQTRHQVALIDWTTVRRGVEAVRDAVVAHQQAGVRHIVADALTDEDLAVLGAAALELPVIAGAAGLAEGVGHAYPAAGPAATEPWPVAGRAAVLAGSCSARTLEQIAQFYAAGLPSLHLDVLAAASGRDVTGEALAWYDEQDPDLPVLIYASASPEELAAVQAQLGVTEAAAQVEELLGSLATHLVERGVRRLVVAGGETSGAVTTALGIRAVLVGEEADPGVPWTYATTKRGDLALMLKSGNFGAPDLFTRALTVAE
ncbi:four-carbon acid sugar kinase family protein [Streptomyces sp. Babs14]|uniref:3-oxo-tetronate kinase n=1 Tax=unclassified Streptomyces TaxID=2593676 RepID=UPI001C21F7AF|nr:MULTISPECIES: 3-oxo-tetronate kinase [unclassified Streptomyces]MBU8548196.1 four-carbon acid sugar kinase family protein [Streptomyces sp. Osf17]MBU8554970.1 four-carbon acid sugar kinase family protein [Streptomyces sp. Babs14]